MKQLASSLTATPPARHVFAEALEVAAGPHEVQGFAPMTQADSAQVWRALIAGEYRVVEQFSTAERAYLVLARVTLPRAPTNERIFRVLESILLGVPCKVVAIDLGLAGSTVALILKQGYQALGLTGASGTFPLGLAVLVHAAHGKSAVPMQRSPVFAWRSNACFVLGASLPSLSAILPPAVNKVLELRAQGHSHARIAQSRRTSRRTIANQIATAYTRLGVSGRSGLLSYLAQAPRSEARSPVPFPRVRSVGAATMPTR